MDHSFVVLAYGDSPFLAGCLRDLADQSRAARILVSTSTPSPFIERAAAEAGAELRVNPEPSGGIAADWNFGLAQAQTRYATLAHQDDTYAPDFTARCLALFAREPQGALCFTGYQEIDDEGAAKSSKISKAKHLIERATIGRREVLRGRRLLAFLSFGNPLPCSSVTFDRTRLPAFRFSSDYRSNLDWEAWWRLAQAGETFLHVPERLVGRRHNALTATSTLIADGTRRVEDLQMFRKAWPRPVADAIAWAYRAGY
ncbi:MAG: hypothetical protein JWP28_3333 [Phenylobacterium sp.]|uniref:glycosyltransferase family 2 protein n=1 Tax=Phenylobacterium sp. TaxID=1871053 RepID=UPI00260D15AC|nr:glycosyltransferase [Phenylobacterium sp.]MDB5499302.1 hypothetical protein [Phenylobacterium sp.]